MSSSNLPNEVFEIMPPFDKDIVFGYRLKYKGKFLHPEIIEDTGRAFDIYMSAEDFLDFDAAFLPEHFPFTLILPEHRCMDLLDVLYFERKDEIIKFNCVFGVNDNPPPDVDLNPIKLVTRFYELAEAKGYKLSYNEYIHRNVILTFPAQGNLYQHYKPHLDIFESLMAQAADEMIKKILGR